MPPEDTHRAETLREILKKQNAPSLKFALGAAVTL